jgi:hypothetical protein
MKSLYGTFGQDFNQWMGSGGGKSAYDFQNNQVQGELNKRLAAQGLGGSGRELQLAQDASNQLTSQYADQYNQAKAADASRFVNDMGTRMNISEQAKGRMGDFVTNMLQLGMQQSPLTTGYNATQNLASMQQGNYNRGGGGGQTYTPPTGPNYTAYNNARLQSQVGQQGSNNNIYNQILTGIPSILKGLF